MPLRCLLTPVASLWITSLHNQLATSLLTTCNRLVVNKLSQAMRTHPDIGLLTTCKCVARCQQTCNLRVLSVKSDYIFNITQMERGLSRNSSRKFAVFVFELHVLARLPFIDSIVMGGRRKNWHSYV